MGNIILIKLIVGIYRFFMFILTNNYMLIELIGITEGGKDVRIYQGRLLIGDCMLFVYNTGELKKRNNTLWIV